MLFTWGWSRSWQGAHREPRFLALALCFPSSQATWVGEWRPHKCEDLLCSKPGSVASAEPHFEQAHSLNGCGARPRVTPFSGLQFFPVSCPSLP